MKTNRNGLREKQTCNQTGKNRAAALAAAFFIRRFLHAPVSPLAHAPVSACAHLPARPPAHAHARLCTCASVHPHTRCPHARAPSPAGGQTVSRQCRQSVSPRPGRRQLPGTPPSPPLFCPAILFTAASARTGAVRFPPFPFCRRRRTAGTRRRFFPGERPAVNRSRNIFSKSTGAYSV